MAIVNRPAPDPRAFIFWDNSNVFIPARYVAQRREGGFADRNIRIQFDNLLQLARAGRNAGAGVCVGSVPPELQGLWERLRAIGVTVELYERGKESGREQGVDQCLQVHMLRTLADVQPPQVAVLLTGDGQGYDTGAGYHADLERLARTGWGIEVLSWDIACNARLRAWAKETGIYSPLEDYDDSVTFIEGGRRATALSLLHRGRAKPRSTS
jgi:hypothetical protein